MQTSYQYDSQGNLITESGRRGTTKYTYDCFNRTISVQSADGGYIKNRYDPEGLRSEVQENGQLSRFVFSGRDVVAELDGNGSLKAATIRGHEILAQKDVRGSSYYYLNNGHGDVTALVDGKGEVVNRYKYDAFGNTAEAVEKVHNRFKYAGEQFDSVTGQYYLKARFYNPVVGRFTQEDTYRGDGLNLYSYVKNNPVKYVDPSGYSCESKSNVVKGPTVEEAADMAEHVYYTKSFEEAQKDKLLGGWQLEDVYQTDSEKDSLRIGVYSRKGVDGIKEYALVNRGSRDFTKWEYLKTDWKNNAQQLFGASKDMKDSIAFSRDFVKDNANARITFVGHSKGGAEAAANAVATNRNAILFNPATVNLKAYGLSSSKYTGDMKAYIVKGEILNKAEGWFSKPIGSAVYLPKQSGGAVDNHLMPSVKKALSQWRKAN
jgi:RHS repeat-associated protein